MSQKKIDGAFNRRKFINMAGLGAAAFAVSPRFAFAKELNTDRKIRMGIIGGGFGTSFYFQEHPNSVVVAVSDLLAERREILMKVYNCKKSYDSLEILIKDPNVEAVFIATPAPDHAKHVLASLNAGKHVLCAVPAAWTLEECAEIKDTVKRTGLTYMMAETSYYRQNAISVRKFYQEGKFGSIFSSSAEYNHPVSEGSELLWTNGKPNWRYGIPPMHYPTHCTSFLIGTTGERLTNVSCLGWGDKSPMLTNNRYANPFCNATAFFKTDKGNPFRVEVNWRGALRNVERAEWQGTKMSFYSHYDEGDKAIIVRLEDRAGVDQGGYQNQENVVEKYDQPVWWKTDMLPKALRHESYHDGAHTFLTHEFIEALIQNRQPTVNIHEALAYTAPGIVAHDSALKGGEYLKIPSFD
jgi:predicted dehydrogenase